MPPPLLVVHEEDQAALAAVYRESEEDEHRRAAVAEQEEAAYEAAMAQAMAVSAAGDCVLPPLTPPSPVKAEPEPSPIKRYSWTGMVREWERRRGEYLEMLERGAEEEQHDTEEEVRKAAAAQSAPDMNAIWNMTFPWAGPAPMLIDLTDP
ncbi:putative xyloglucan endotransglucosylase/hydrolase protein 30 [Hordeum vulgare]|nr:putative xyloglucan endotransglucosylase/hydrolase protein 30 [Hordeum vulgare]KAE8775700.1 putative xyloglucan endotransglucosylase/hydrolase protein 30 [Hordeum vulgare]